MRLVTIVVSHFKNFTEPQTIRIEGDVTCLVGKNESGKTTVLQALHRLNPANGTDLQFDATIEYPRWRLARDRRSNDLDQVKPISARYAVDDSDREALREALGVLLPPDTIVDLSRDYGGVLHVGITTALRSVVEAAGVEAALDSTDVAKLADAGAIEVAVALAQTEAQQLNANGEPARARALDAFPKALQQYAFLLDELSDEVKAAILKRIPKSFYFSTYQTLPGEVDLVTLAEKVKKGTQLSGEEQTVVALLRNAGETPSDFLDDDYDSRKAELQAASLDLSRRAFDYWRQNTDLTVIFDTDMPVVGTGPQGQEIRHRFLKIELGDARHGGVQTNFTTRSAGFQWFFSFFAAFSEYQDSEAPLIVLLDEPGTSLHGEAQKDFVRFVFEELGNAKQTVYTTHSQYLVDPARYEKLRAVQDRATREEPGLGVTVTDVDLSADRDTVLPLESALGYTISQHLFLGSGHHLAVEGSSDFVYLQRLSEYLLGLGEPGLDPRLAAIPVGGDSNMPAFVALLGRRLQVSALIDGSSTPATYARVVSAAKANGVPEASIVVCSSVAGVPKNGDVEDLFDPEDYLRLYNWAFSATVRVVDLAPTNEPILRRLGAVVGSFNHALPAHALTERREEFFTTVHASTVERFRELFRRLNTTVA